MAEIPELTTEIQDILRERLLQIVIVYWDWMVKNSVQLTNNLDFFCKDTDQVVFQNENSRYPQWIDRGNKN